MSVKRKASQVIFPYKFTMIVIGLALLRVSFGQHHDPLKVSQKDQEKWLKQTSGMMLGFKPGDSPLMDAHITAYDEYYKISYRLMKTGYIQLENQSWIYFISSSSHDNPEIGDITVAMDNQKRFFINRGHICGGMIHFQSEKKIDLRTPDDFFTNFREDVDNDPWTSFTDY